MKTIGFLVTQGGRPCTLFSATATAFTKRGGMLVPAGAGKPVVIFGRPRDAKRAIKRTRKVIDTLKGSLVEEWIKLGPFQGGEGYEILPLAKQAGEPGAEEEA